MAEVAIDPRLASERFRERIPRDFARCHAILSQGCVDGVERIAAGENTSPAPLHNVSVRLGQAIEVVRADSERVVRAIDVLYGELRPAPERHDALEVLPQGETLDDLLRNAERDLLRTQGKGSVQRLVDALLFDAVGRNASDVHLQPTDGDTLVRVRMDGALVTVRKVPKGLTPAVLGRIKVMGRMDVAERRLPQDGRATVRIGARSIDLRIGIFPTSYGERAVLRILDSSRRLLDLEGLGMPSSVLQPFLRAASRADGLVLVTGPTGSGKTTTLYSTLSRIASPDCNVMTIEDPIEYDLAGSAGGAEGAGRAGNDGEARSALSITQSQVNLKKGVSFASGLRHLLRQDPDVILVGEIRDLETARMAIQSSLTGHLVFSTLHTNDAPSAVTRLIDLGIEPFLVSASLMAVLAQRLLRIVHQECSGRGCEGCLQTGYLGRLAVFELMEIDERARSLIARGADLEELRAAARAAGMRTLLEEGERLVAEGITTRVELKRVIQGAAE